MLQIARVANCIYCKLHVLQIVDVANSTCCKLHVLQIGTNLFAFGLHIIISSKRIIHLPCYDLSQASVQIHYSSLCLKNFVIIISFVIVVNIIL